VNQAELKKKRSDYFFIELDLPAGLNPIQEDQVYENNGYKIKFGRDLYTRRVFNQGQIVWYIDSSSKYVKDYTFSIVARAGYSGKFSSGVAKVTDFYDDSIQAYTSARTITFSRK
jgi:uncharacterized protein YfaS (alpha-2-macroglobulin family)